MLAEICPDCGWSPLLSCEDADCPYMLALALLTLPLIPIAFCIETDDLRKKLSFDF